MKKILLIGLIASSLAIVGCTTTQTSLAIKSEGVIVVTVDTGMKAWAQIVNSGGATAIQVNTVENAYNTYYNAQLISEATLLKVVSGASTNTTDIVTANTATANAEGALLSLLNQYLVKSTTK